MNIPMRANADQCLLRTVTRFQARRRALPNRSGSVVDRRCGGNRPDHPIRHGWEVPLPLCCACSASASRVTGGIPSRLASGRPHKHWGRGPRAVRVSTAHGSRKRRPLAGEPSSPTTITGAAPPAARPGGLRQAHRSSVLDQLSVVGHRGVQPAPPPVLPAGASPGPTVLPGTTWLPPAARVTVTRRAWAFGDAGMVTCRTPSA
jgi:hypothetical protein